MPEVIFNGPAGRLEGRYHHSPHPRPPLALILHPHPVYGGTMNNRVVYEIYYAFQRKGFSVLRFNFRGVGRSQGQFDSGVGELSDAASALDWLQLNNPNASECWIAGFSFGSWVALQLLMRRPELVSFIAVSPPANMFDFGFLAPCPSSGLIIHGDDDQVAPRPAVQKLLERLQSQKAITVDFTEITGANHFYEDQLPDLARTVEGYIEKRRAAKADG
ncbi:MAG: alpha/beta hydrolase [Alphaproteobacteria bacterium]|nr:alpha/beta hydrolase [Alphaproteobacteria bacterium]